MVRIADPEPISNTTIAPDPLFRPGEVVRIGKGARLNYYVTHRHHDGATWRYRLISTDGAVFGTVAESRLVRATTRRRVVG